jgi:hypothetical protein
MHHKDDGESLSHAQMAVIWRMARFAQPHILMYMFCPCVISTHYQLLEELQMRTFKRYFSLAILLTTTLHLREIN